MGRDEAKAKQQNEGKRRKIVSKREFGTVIDGKIQINKSINRNCKRKERKRKMADYEN